MEPPIKGLIWTSHFVHFREVTGKVFKVKIVRGSTHQHGKGNKGSACMVVQFRARYSL